MPNISLQEMIDAGLHFGHQTRRWNPKMKPFLYGERNGIYIIDLQQTVQRVADACRFVAKTVAEGGNVLFVGTKPAARPIIEAEARRCNMFHITHRWLGGTLTNFRTIRGGVERMKKIESMMTDGTFNQITKKERQVLSKEKEKLERNHAGIREMGRLPSVLFVVDVNFEDIAVAEANRLGIPVVAIVDTNCSPDPIDYVIPGNDDSVRCISLITSWIADSVQEGLSRRDERLMAEADKDAKSAADHHPGADEKRDDAGPVVARRKSRKRAGAEAEEGEETYASDSAHV